MCPDPALLVAYLDGTLFHRDKNAIDQHVQGCTSCTALLAAMQRQRALEDRSKRSRSWAAGAVTAAFLVAAFVAWLVLKPEPTSQENSDTTAVEAEQPGVSAAAATPTPRETVASPASDARPAGPAGRRAASPPAHAAHARTAPTPPVKSSKVERAAGETVTGATPGSSAATAPVDTGLTLHGGKSGSFWRVRDRTIEHSTDGGRTWLSEYTVDRIVRAGSVVDANVAWLVGNDGLVLRRTKNGWFGASPPAEGNLVAVRASSPSKATVTLDDGRAFSTENGGVNWTAR